MKGEEEGRKRCGSGQAHVASFTWTRQGRSQDPAGHEIEDRRIRGVQEEVGQMIPDGIHAPEEVVQPEGHPGQGSVVTYVGRGPHPAEVGPTEAAVLRVLDEIVIVVPVHKLVVERGQERNDGDERNQDWEKPEALLLRWLPVLERNGGAELARLALAAHESGHVRRLFHA